MFNTYRRAGDVSINIRQLPHDTADAARLYGELAAKAEKDVAAATVERLGAENEAFVVRVDGEHCCATLETRTRVLFKLNGRLYDVRTACNSLPRDELRRTIANAIAEEAYKALGGS